MLCICLLPKSDNDEDADEMPKKKKEKKIKNDLYQPFFTPDKSRMNDRLISLIDQCKDDVAKEYDFIDIAKEEAKQIPRATKKVKVPKQPKKHFGEKRKFCKKKAKKKKLNREKKSKIKAADQLKESRKIVVEDDVETGKIPVAQIFRKEFRNNAILKRTNYVIRHRMTTESPYLKKQPNAISVLIDVMENAEKDIEKDEEVKLAESNKSLKFHYSTTPCCISSLKCGKVLRNGLESGVKVATMANILGTYLELNVLVRHINNVNDNGIYYKAPNQTSVRHCMMSFIDRPGENVYPCSYYPEIRQILSEEVFSSILKEDGRGLEYVIDALALQSITCARTMIMMNLRDWISDWCQRQILLYCEITSKGQVYLAKGILKSWILHRISPVKIPDLSNQEITELREDFKNGNISKAELDLWLEACIGKLPDDISSDSVRHRNSLYEAQRQRAKDQLFMLITEEKFSPIVHFHGSTISTIQRWLEQYGQAYRRDTNEMMMLTIGIIQRNAFMLYPWMLELIKSIEMDTLLFQAKQMDIPKGICKTFSLIPLPSNDMKFISLNKYTLPGLVKYSNLLLANTEATAESKDDSEKLVPIKAKIWWKSFEEFQKCEGFWKRKNSVGKFDHLWQSKGTPYSMTTDGVSARILYKTKLTLAQKNAMKGKSLQEEKPLTLEEVFIPGNVISVVDLGLRNYAMCLQMGIGEDKFVKSVEIARTRGREARHIKGNKLKQEKVSIRFKDFKISEMMTRLLSFKVSGEAELDRACAMYIELYPKIRRVFEGKKMRQIRADQFRREHRGNDILAGKIMYDKTWADERKEIKLPRSIDQCNHNKATRRLINKEMRARRKKAGLNDDTIVILGDVTFKNGGYGHTKMPFKGVKKALRRRKARVHTKDEHLTSSICPCCFKEVNHPQKNVSTTKIYFTDEQREEVKGDEDLIDLYGLLSCKNCGECAGHVRKFDRDVLGAQNIFYKFLLEYLQGLNKSKESSVVKLSTDPTLLPKGDTTGPTQVV